MYSSRLSLLSIVISDYVYTSMCICYVKFRVIYMCELGCICLLKPCLNLVVKIVRRTCHISMGISWESIYSVRSRIGAYWSCTEDEWMIFTTPFHFDIGRISKCSVCQLVVPRCSFL